MSHALYRLGRFAARRPVVMVGAWLILAIAVVGASSAFGRDLDDSVAVPGLDSQKALELLSSAQSENAGLTAYVVATPLDEGATFFESDAARADLAELQAEVAALPKVIDITDPAGALDEGETSP